MPTILELFRSKQLNFPAGSTADSAVKKDTETLIEQETTGIRVKSAVDHFIDVANLSTSVITSPLSA